VFEITWIEGAGNFSHGVTGERNWGAGKKGKERFKRRREEDLDTLFGRQEKPDKAGFWGRGDSS